MMVSYIMCAVVSFIFGYMAKSLMHETDQVCNDILVDYCTKLEDELAEQKELVKNLMNHEEEQK